MCTVTGGNHWLCLLIVLLTENHSWFNSFFACLLLVRGIVPELLLCSTDDVGCSENDGSWVAFIVVVMELLMER